MTSSPWLHLSERVRRLSCAIRFDDHFLDRPVPEELAVVLEGAEPPVLNRSGLSRRHDDGTYRFSDLPEGTYTLRASSRTGTWTRWEPLPALTLPLAAPSEPIVVQLWPTPRASSLRGVTSLRARLAGPAAAGLKLEVAAVSGSDTAAWNGRYTRSDHDGELLFVLPSLPADVVPNSKGKVIVEVRVESGSRTVLGTAVRDGTAVTTSDDNRFSILAGGETRVTVNI